MTDIELLRAELKKITSYPEGLKAIDCGISGIGFFPGARGLWTLHDESLFNKSIMILGHDFGAERDYENSVTKGEENMKALTWSNLVKALKDYDIRTENCFFTNCIMGVRTNGISALGKSIGFNNPEFSNDCRDFLIKQISIQRPKLIIALGLHILAFLSKLSPKLSDLVKVKSFKILDGKNLSSIENIEFDKISNYKTNITFITHPTYRHLNIDNRSFNGFNGVEAERALIKQLI